MKNILISLSIIILFCIGFTSAVPQIVNTQFNLTIFSNQSGNITTGTYQIFGEGGQLNNNFAITGNCSFNYNLNNIPLIFSREIQQNDTDVATLIHALAINNNISQEWKDCIQNLSICTTDVGYKGNYTQKTAELDICYRARDDYSNQIKTLNDNLSGMTTWRNIGFIVGIIGLGAAFWLYRKQNIKVADNYYNYVTEGAVQH